MSYVLRARCKALAQLHHPCSPADAGAQLSTDSAHDSWTPAFAGERVGARGAFNQRHHPGEGRGPVGKVAMMERRPSFATSPSWAPASAGVGREVE